MLVKLIKLFDHQTDEGEIQFQIKYSLKLTLDEG